MGEIELLLAGGAAGMLAGILDADRTTTDCDVMLYRPAEARELVERLAVEVAAEFGLAEHWLNSGGAPWMEAMPPGWLERRRLVLSRGPLRVHAVGRLDFIALKLVAGRPQDIEDLEVLGIVEEEFVALRRHFAEWSDDSWPPGTIAGARELLEILADAVTLDADTTAGRKRAFLAGLEWVGPGLNSGLDPGLDLGPDPDRNPGPFAPDEVPTAEARRVQPAAAPPPQEGT